MSCTCTTPGSPDEDGVFSFSISFTGPSRSGDDFGERLSLYMSAPEHFAPRSETELREVRETAAAMEAEWQAEHPNEDECEPCDEWDPLDFPWSWQL